VNWGRSASATEEWEDGALAVLATVCTGMEGRSLKKMEVAEYSLPIGGPKGQGSIDNASVSVASVVVSSQGIQWCNLRARAGEQPAEKSRYHSWGDLFEVIITDTQAAQVCPPLMSRRSGYPSRILRS